MELWHIWMLAAVALFIIEIFTPAFVCACLGIGCATGGIGAAINSEGYVLQWTLFAMAAAVSFAYLRPIMLKFYHNRAAVKTNTDVLTGKSGRVTESIDYQSGKGRVNVGGDDWRARTADRQPLPVNTPVTVIGLDGITVIVEKSS